MKVFKIGFSAFTGLDMEIDDATISTNKQTKGEGCYVGYIGSKGKFAIYITIEDVVKGENGSGDTGLVNIRVADYETLEKIKDYTIKLSSEWHTLDEVN